MKLIVAYPIIDKTFNENLATFKAKLLLKSIDNLDASDKIKDDLLDKILEILNNMPQDSVI